MTDQDDAAQAKLIPQRMHEDARHLTELSADLGTGLLQAGTLLALFVHVLWRISSEDELTRLAFAPVLLRKPAWVLIDEVLDNLDADTLAVITDVIGGIGVRYLFCGDCPGVVAF